MMHLPTFKGYSIFTQRIHQNPITGVIHGVCTPIIAVSAFTIIHSIIMIVYRRSKGENFVTIRERTKKILWMVLGWYMSGYLTHSPWYGILTVLKYWYILDGAINRMSMSYSPIQTQRVAVNRMSMSYSPIQTQRVAVNRIGGSALIIAGNIIIMEFIGHWLLEGKGSDVSLLLNSIYQTPLYGTISIVRSFGYLLSAFHRHLFSFGGLSDDILP